jgi:hypothetical protein
LRSKQADSHTPIIPFIGRYPQASRCTSYLSVGSWRTLPNTLRWIRLRPSEMTNMLFTRVNLRRNGSLDAKNPLFPSAED